MANRTTTQLQALQNQTPIDWSTESTATQPPSPSPQYPQTFIGATPKKTPYKSYDLARKRFEEEREQQKRDEITANLYGGIFDVMDPLGAVGADVGSRLTKQFGGGEGAQDLGALLGDLVTGVSPKDVGRLGTLLGSPKVIDKVMREFDALARKFDPRSETATAAEKVLKGERPIRVTEQEQAYIGGKKVGGFYGPSVERTPQQIEEGISPREVLLSSRGKPDRPYERTAIAHELPGHAVHEELPFEAQREIARATKTGDLPLHPTLIKEPAYLKLNEMTKGNENRAFWLADVLSGKLEWTVGEAARFPGSKKHKSALKAFDYLRGQGFIPGRPNPISEVTKVQQQLQALKPNL